MESLYPCICIPLLYSSQSMPMHIYYLSSLTSSFLKIKRKMEKSSEDKLACGIEKTNVSCNGPTDLTHYTGKPTIWRQLGGGCPVITTY